MEFIDEQLAILKAQKTLIESQSALKMRQLNKAIESLEFAKTNVTEEQTL
jgi:hypothetical protein